MKFFFAALLSLTACGGCHVVLPSSDPSTVAWNSLVAAKCSAPDPDGPKWVALQLDAGAPAWLSCLADGKPVVACSVPCPAPKE